MLGFLDLLITSLFVAISLAILVPLTGGLVRFRANYNPKALRLNDPEEGVQAHTGPIVSTFVGMMRRVYKIEGIPGLYKGLMPTLISVIVVTVFVWIFFDPTNARNGAYVAPATGPWGILVYSLFQMLISLPVVVVTYRCVVNSAAFPRITLNALNQQCNHNASQTTLFPTTICPSRSSHPY